jgi:hypothetical protein
MKKMIYKIVKAFSFIIVFLILFLLAYRLVSYHYLVTFENINIGDHLEKVKKKWGHPDIEFIYKDLNDCIIYKYKKDPLGWDTYIFIFDPIDSLLVSKNIDD